MHPDPVVLATWGVGALLTALVLGYGMWANKPPHRGDPLLATVSVILWPLFWLMVLFGAVQYLGSSRRRRPKAVRLWNPLRVGLLVVALTLYCCVLVGVGGWAVYQQQVCVLVPPP